MKDIALQIIKDEGFYAVPSNDNITRVEIARKPNHRVKYEHIRRQKKNFDMMKNMDGLVELMADILEERMNIKDK